MKRLDEKLSLLHLAQAFGMEPDPQLLEDIKQLQEKEALKTKQQQALKTRVHKASKDLFNASVQKDAPVLKNQEALTQEVISEEILIQPKPQTLVDLAARSIKETVVSQGEPALVPKPADPLVKKVELLEKWISRIAATGPGGGEVNLRWLDDVDRSTITDDYYLRYEASTKKFMFDAGHKNNFYLAAQSIETQTSSATSATAMTFNVIDSNYGITITSNSIIVIPSPGTYNLQFGAQFVNTANTPDDVYIWLRQNGANVPGSNGTVTIPSKDNANVPGKVITSWNYLIVTTSVSETIQLMWFAVDDTHVTMPFISSIAATATSPEIPGTASVILTVTPVKVDSY